MKDCDNLSVLWSSNYHVKAVFCEMGHSREQVFRLLSQNEGSNVGETGLPGPILSQKWYLKLADNLCLNSLEVLSTLKACPLQERKWNATERYALSTRPWTVSSQKMSRLCHTYLNALLLGLTLSITNWSFYYIFFPPPPKLLSYFSQTFRNI